MFFLADWFITFIYQPFFNLLVGIYLILDKVSNGNADMGTAVILFTVAFRLIWLPISLSSGTSLKEREEITKKITEINEQHAHDPVARKANVKQVFRGNRRILITSTINITFQMLIALMLWRIFAKGLKGEDFHLLYSFMPAITEPFNLTFLQKYDLTQPSWTLNIIQSLAIFVFEALTAVFSVTRTTYKDVIRMQLALPVVSLIIFMALPAGKKLFIITTLLFSIFQTMIVQLYYWLTTLGKKLDNFVLKTSKPDDKTLPKESLEVNRQNVM